MTGFDSIALRDIPCPDYADVVLVPLPPGASTDPAHWAREMFDIHAMPRWIAGLLALRQVAVRLIGLEPSPRDVFAVREVEGDEALISADDRHLDFRATVGVDAGRSLVRVVTVVRIKGWRGRVYFAPVALAHPVIVRSMVKRAARRAAAEVVAGP